ncbi:aldo/keto reductase [Exilibacterium tricleocarpae]|uniref:Aldo/keto reductase n=1 Tax=Exilibacterium tricleocarpae TaxID=2591008 RepID=A0A545TLD9_9GAMM|nr:aldo/keto reductase [Exilibacterium tricleocarpae]TQV78029.1 aldo/keto reductase [Exilibacterium tricleocarpae]
MNNITNHAATDTASNAVDNTFNTTATKRTFRLGGEREINRLGYGAMRLTGQPANFGPYPQWEAGKALLQRAVELGVNFFDSARAYGPEWADKIIAEALHPYDKQVMIATKGGVDKLAPDQIVTDGRPQTLEAQIDAALSNLKVEQIELFQLHRVDPNVPIEDSVGAIDRARLAGKVRFIGLSNVDREQLDRALTVAPIASIQNRFNQAEQAQSALVDYTATKGIAFIPYGPLGAHPMRQGAGLKAQQALVWLLKRSPNIIVIPGTTSVAHLEENLAAWHLM